MEFINILHCTLETINVLHTEHVSAITHQMIPLFGSRQQHVFPITFLINPAKDAGSLVFFFYMYIMLV